MDDPINFAKIKTVVIYFDRPAQLERQMTYAIRNCYCLSIVDSYLIYLMRSYLIYVDLEE